MALNENITVRLMADVSNYSAQMRLAANASDDLAKSVEKPMSSGQKVGAVFTKVGTAVGAVSAAIGVSAVKAFMDFDAAMSEVQANTGAAGDELNALRSAALEAGSTTVYSATESAQAINELGKAGMSTADILSGGLSGALNLAASDGMAVADAAEYMSSALSMFHLEGSRAADVADALAAGAGEALGGVADFGEALNNCGAQAYSFGMSMEETVGVLALFAENGLVGATAGTQLNSMLNRLASPTTAAQKAMDELGISVYDASGNFVGMANLAGQLAEKQAGLSQEARNAANATIFGSYAIKAANYLYQAGADGVQAWTDKVSQSGYAADLAAAKTDNLKGDLTKLGSAVEGMLIGIGDGANGPLRGIVQMVTNLVSAFSSLPPAVQQTAVVLGALGGATILLHKRFGSMAESTSAFSRSLGLMVDPVQRVQSLFAGLQGAGMMLRQAFMPATMQLQTFGTVLTRTQGIAGAAKSAFGGIIGSLGGPWGAALTAAAAAVSIFAGKQQEAQQKTEALQSALEASGGSAETLISAIEDVDWGWWDEAQTGCDNLKDALSQAGISMADFARAAQGNEDAIARVNAQLELYRDGSMQHHSASNLIQKDLENLSQQYSDYTARTGEHEAAVSELSDAERDNASASSEAASAAETAAAAWELGEKAVSEQADAIAECVSQMQKYYNYAISAGEAQIKMYDAFDAAAESVEKYGQNTDIATEAGRKNMSVLYDIASATIAAAEAQARNGATAEELNGTLDLGREKLKFFAEQMKLGNVDQFVKDCGLGEDAAKRLAASIEAAQNGGNIDVTASVDTSEAAAQIDSLDVKLTSLPDGKTMIYADNQDVIAKIAEITGLEIDKEGRITCDSSQYDSVYSLIQSLRVDPKTGEIIADASKYQQSYGKVEGLQVAPKTGVINGNNNPFKGVYAQTEGMKLSPKYTNLYANDHATPTLVSIQAYQFSPKYVDVITRHSDVYTSADSSGNLVAKGGGRHVKDAMATGGMVHGPGTGTSDSIPVMLSNGEYVINARATAAHLPLLEKINNFGRYAAGGLVQAAPARRYMTVESKPAVQYVQNVTNRMYSAGDQQVQARLLAAKMQVATRKLLK